MSVRSIEAEVSIKSGIEAECTIGREVVVEIHDDVNLEALTATANGSYRPESGVDGWDRVTVSVPERQPITEPLSVTANGQYEPSEGVDGFSDVTVSVPERIPVTESLSVTENGTYEPTGGVDGYDSVSVAVPERRPTFTLIGQSTHVLQEYESTTAEVINTGIDIKNTDYAFLLVIITCDGVKTNAKDWGGLTIGMVSRYTTTGAAYAPATADFSFKDNTISFASMTNNPNNTTYGVYLANNTNTIQFCRKANGTSCPKLMTGTYTVKVYGLTAL